MKINETVLAKMLESINKALPSFHSHWRGSKRYVKRFMLVFTDAEKEFIVKEMLHSQNKSIAKAMLQRKNIAIPNIGSFQYRESLEIIRELKNEIKAKYGVTDLRKVDEETFMKINDELEARKKEILIPLYYQQIKKDNINYDFLNSGKT